MRRKYSEFNRKYFNGSLPDASRVVFSVNNRRNPMGMAFYLFNRLTLEITRYEIALSNFYDTTEHGKEAVLVHEMCHISHYQKRIMDFLKRDRYGRLTSDRSFDGHTGFFLEEAARVNSMSDYNVSRYYPSESSEEAANDDLYRLSDKARKKYEKDVRFCIARKDDEILCYFYCDPSRMEFFEGLLSRKGYESEWFATMHKNVLNLEKSVRRANLYFRNNPDENNREFIVGHFNLTPLNPSLNEMIDKAVKHAISELDSQGNHGVEASSFPFVREEGDTIVYGIE